MRSHAAEAAWKVRKIQDLKTQDTRAERKKSYWLFVIGYREEKEAPVLFLSLFKGFEPGIEFVVKLLGEEAEPGWEIAGVGGFEGVVIGVAELGGNGNRRISFDSCTIRTSHAAARLATDSGESGRSAVRRWCLGVRVVIWSCRYGEVSFLQISDGVQLF